MMSTGTFELQLKCEQRGCIVGVHIVVITPVGKGTRPLSLEQALEAASLQVGMRRVHSTGARAQVFCAEHLGPIECRRCRFPYQLSDVLNRITCGCLGSAMFDVDRRHDEVNLNPPPDPEGAIDCREFLCLPERNPSHYVNGRHLPIKG